MRGALVPAAAAIVSIGAAVGATAMTASGQEAPMSMSTPMHMDMPMHASAASATVVRTNRKVVRIAPARVVVSPGTRIVWTNNDSDPHTVVSRSGPAHWSSPAMDTGHSYAQTVRRKGTEKYFCSIHPFMHGTVIVK